MRCPRLEITWFSGRTATLIPRKAELYKSGPCLLRLTIDYVSFLVLIDLLIIDKKSIGAVLWLVIANLWEHCRIVNWKDYSRSSESKDTHIVASTRGQLLHHFDGVGSASLWLRSWKFERTVLVHHFDDSVGRSREYSLNTSLTQTLLLREGEHHILVHHFDGVGSSSLWLRSSNFERTVLVHHFDNSVGSSRGKCSKWRTFIEGILIYHGLCCYGRWAGCLVKDLHLLYIQGVHRKLFHSGDALKRHYERLDFNCIQREKL